MNKNEKLNIKELDKGVEMISMAFTQQKQQYLTIIDSLKEKIILLEKQIMQLKNENIVYKNKINSIQKNIRHISSSICRLKEDENTDINNDNDNDIKEKKDISEVKHNIKRKISKEKNNSHYNRKSLNKYQLKRFLHQNYKSFNNFSERKEIEDFDIKMRNKRQYYIKKNTLKNYYNIKKRNKKYSLNNICNDINNNDITNNIILDNKTERLNKKNLYDINGNYL